MLQEPRSKTPQTEVMLGDQDEMTDTLAGFVVIDGTDIRGINMG